MLRSRTWPFIGLLRSLAGFPLATIYPATLRVLLDTIQRELHRATAALAKTDPSPYYLSYSVADANSATIVGTSGSLIVSSEVHRRMADVMMRVGPPASTTRTVKAARPASFPALFP